MKHLNTGLKWLSFSLIGVLLIMLVGTLMQPGDVKSTRPGPINDATTTSFTAPAPVQTHRYYSEENGTYYYAQALSADQIAAGIGGSKLIGLRYMGIINGGYVLSGDNGLTTLTCSEPCDVITIHTPGNVEKIAFSPEIIAGQAINDVRDGFIKHFDMEAEAQRNQREWEGYQTGVVSSVVSDDTSEN